MGNGPAFGKPSSYPERPKTHTKRDHHDLETILLERLHDHHCATLQQRILDKNLGAMYLLTSADVFKCGEERGIGWRRVDLAP
jgi:hypothetical protein